MHKTLQQLIDETPEGGELHLGETLYKESVTIAKNITIVGVIDEPDDPWYDYDYKTLIEGNVVITASNPIFEGCSFDFGDKPLILENGVSPSFKECFFEADQLIAEISDENTNPSFYSCRFAGPESSKRIRQLRSRQFYSLRIRLQSPIRKTPPQSLPIRILEIKSQGVAAFDHLALQRLCGHGHL